MYGGGSGAAVCVLAYARVRVCGGRGDGGGRERGGDVPARV